MNLLKLLFVVTFASTVVHSQVCTGFGSGTVGSQYIYQHYSGAVLRVQDVGTAFLIDSERGYLLTAGHVLDDLALKKESLEVISGDYPYSHLQFAMRYRSPDADVALLQLTQPDALKNVLPLDIAFDPPDLDTKLVVMGYPQFGQQGQIFRRSGEAKISAYPPNGLIEVSHTTAGGSSGGPLIDPSGDAIATCQEEIAQNQVGRYLPLSAFEAVLDQIPTSPRMQKLEADLISGKTNLDDFKQLLKKTNTQTPTNLEIYAWTHRLSSSSLQKISKYLKCPLIPALVERHIPDAILPFTAALPRQDVGALNLTLAQREYTMGNNPAAANFADTAAAYFHETMSVPKSPLEDWARLLGGVIQRQRDLGNAEVIRQDAVPVNVLLDSGVNQKYLVQWLGTIDVKKVEEGHPAEPLKGWLTDTRQCRWSIQSQVLRNVYYVGTDHTISTDHAVSKIFAAGFGNKGSDFVFTQLRPENCNDAASRFESDVKDARSAIAKKFSEVTNADIEAIARDLGALPHVRAVDVLSGSVPLLAHQ